ncbi:hypothetical protein 1 [Hubei picorna-like virus 16]|uniref:hypothetical protein 1 n=1 Tax=Hubei picorna-like virus 16 TaxID=1923095 RepID=UPI00090B45A0|nr:hypothetical protein 1 [Hubei picorna-like virus 16]APG78036.1 hypothetical protein 1 [Hubei picorna-like virus 16]
MESLKNMARNRILLNRYSSIVENSKINEQIKEMFNLQPKIFYNIHYEYWLKINFVNGKYKTNKGLNLHSLLCTLEDVDDNFAKNIFSFKLNLMNNQINYNNKNFWRKQLVKLEGTKFWFIVFKDIYYNSYMQFKKGDLSTTKLYGRQLTIDMTPKWYNRLHDIKFFETFKYTCIEHILNNFDKLILCGDVELNPGPAIMSLPQRYNNSSLVRKHVAHGLTDSISAITDINEFLNKKLPSIMTQFESLIEIIDIKAKVNINDANTILQDTDDKIKKDIELVNDIGKTITDKISNLNSNFFKFAFALLLLWIMYDFGFKKTTFLIGGVILLKLLGLPEKIIKMVNDMHRHETQSFSFKVNTFGPILLSLISFYAVGKLPKDSSIENFSKKINNISRGIHGAITMKSDFSMLWDEIKKFFKYHLSDISEEFMSMEKEIEQWSDDIMNYTDIVKKKQSMLLHGEISKIASLLQKGIKYKKWAYENKCEARIVRNIIEMTRHAEQLYKYADTHNTLGGGQRQRPLSIVLFGESQIGKSCLIQMLSQDLCAAAGFKTSKEVEEQIYARQPETEYWDGYNGQYIVIRDDCLAQNDESSNPNAEIFETIREMNDFPYHLHMAAIEDKNSYYSSKVSIMTVNNINTPIKSLSYPEAFYNRIQDNMFEVIPSDDYLKEMKFPGNIVKRVLNLEKVANLLNKLTLEKGYPVVYATEIYKFKKYCKVYNDGKLEFQATNEPLLNYDDFSSMMCNELKKKTNNFEHKKNFMEKRWAEKHIAQVYDEDFQECNTRLYVDINDEICNYYSKQLFELGDIDLVEIKCLEQYGNAFVMWKNGAKQKQTKDRIYDIYNDLKNSLKNWFFTYKKKLDDAIIKYPLLRYILIGGGILMASFSLISLYRQFKDDIEIHHATELMSSPSSGQQKLFKKLRVENHSNEAYNSPGSGHMKNNKRMKVEISSDQNASDLSVGLLKHNSYALSYKENGCAKFIGNATIVSGYNVLLPWHFIHHFKLYKLKPDTIFTLSRINSFGDEQKGVIEFPLKCICNEKYELINAIRLNDGTSDLDAILFNLSKESTAHAHRDIVKHFIRKGELGRLHGNMTGIIPVYTPTQYGISQCFKTVCEVSPSDRVIEITSIDDSIYHQRTGYLYKSDTTRGDCGSMLIIKSNVLTNKLVGMHVSGARDEGFSIKLTYEILRDGIDRLTQIIGHRAQVFLEIDDNILIDKEEDTPKGCFNGFGHTKIPLHQCSRTVLSPSLIFNEIKENITKPAHLKPFMKDGKLFDPALKGLEKNGGISKLISIKYCNMATNYVLQKISYDYRKIGTHNIRVMSYEESIRGNDDEYISAVCRTTSPGYPFNSDGKYKNNKPGKQYWLGSDMEFDFTSPQAIELKKIVKQLEEDCLNGKITGVICADTMKDEKRPIAKVDEGKTRMFSACPMHYVILFRKYFIGAASFLMHNRNKNSIAVGTNVYSEDWNDIAKILESKGKAVIAGDFSNFDGSLLVQVLWLVYDIIENIYKMYDKHYTEDARKIRYSLWVHLVNSVHIHGNKLYQWTHSQPSGNPFTVIINSIYNLLIMVMGYLHCADHLQDEEERIKYFNTMMFDKLVSIIVYGDDNCLNIHHSIRHFFNQQTLTIALEDLGHTYTEETKGNEIHLYRSLSEINFLKRAFKYDNDLCRYLAPLDENVIYEMLNWVRKNDVDPNDLLKTNIETAAMEMALHGQDKYEKYVENIRNNEKCKNKLRIILPTYEEMKMRVCNLQAYDGFMA